MASNQQRVFRHTLVQIIGRALGTIIGLVAVGIVTRSLGTDGFGAYTTITAYLSAFAVLADFGISTTLVAMLAEKNADEERLAKNAFGLRITMTTLVLAVAAGIALLTPYSKDIKQGILIMIVSFIAIAANQIQIAIFQRHVRMDRPALAEVLGRVFLLIGVIISAALHGGLFGILLAVIVSNVLQAIVAGVLLRGISPLTPAWDFAIWKKILSRAWPVGISIALNLIYLRADTLILSFTRTQAEVGLYGAAYRVIDVLTVLPFLFMGVVLPFLASAWSHEDKPKFFHTLQRALDALVLGAAPLAAGTLILGTNALVLVAGEPFRSAGVILELLIFGVAAIFIGAAFTHAVVAANAQKQMLPLLATDAVISFVLYLIFIPKYGALAAATITVFSEIFAAAAAYIVAYRITKRHPSASIALRAIAASMLMMLAILAIPESHTLIRVCVGIISYGIFATLLRAVDIKTLFKFIAKPTA